MNRELPGGAWQALLPRALVLIGEIRCHGGVNDPFWTLGGGTILMFRHRHRLSKDIEIFVPNPQYLGFVTPRLSDVAANLTSDYSEDPSAWVKLQFEEGEVDFVAAPIFSMMPGRNGRSMGSAYAWKRRRKSSPRKCSIGGIEQRPETCSILRWSSNASRTRWRPPQTHWSAIDQRFLIRSAIPIRH